MTRWLAALAISFCCCGVALAQDPKPEKPGEQAEEKAEEKAKREAEAKAKAEAEAKAKAEAKARAAMDEHFAVPSGLKDGEVHLEYTFADVNEGADWSDKGLEVFNIGDGGSSSLGARAFEAMYMGAKNQWGVVLHSLDLVGDYTISMTCEMPSGGAVTRNSSFAILLGFKKKPSIGLLWGTQIVKLKKGFGMRALSKRPAEPFPNARQTKLQIVRKGDELTLHLNGRKVGSKKVKGKDLDGKIGFLAKDVQMTVHEVSIVGTPNLD